MNQNSLSLDQLKKLFTDLSLHMISNKDLLTHADQAIGDGDHGIGMARGFEGVLKKLENDASISVDQLFTNVGITLLSSIGGASGAIFGSFFIGAADGLKGNRELDSNSFILALQYGLEKVKELGKAKIGDKTMVDALEPAYIAAKECSNQSLIQITKKAATAAENGKEQTKQYIATTGKAKTLGERSLGHADPGAISMVLILKFCAEFVEQTLTKE